MTLTSEQFNALIEYIDAAICSQTDTGQSADAGLVSAIQKQEAYDRLKTLLCLPNTN